MIENKIKEGKHVYVQLWEETYLKMLRETKQLQQEIDRLHKNEIIYHKRLANIKKLNRDEVEKIIGVDDSNGYLWERTITAICNLAIKPSCTYLGNDKILNDN